MKSSSSSSSDTLDCVVLLVNERKNKKVQIQIQTRIMFTWIHGISHSKTETTVLMRTYYKQKSTMNFMNRWKRKEKKKKTWHSYMIIAVVSSFYVHVIKKNTEKNHNLILEMVFFVLVFSMGLSRFWWMPFSCGVLWIFSMV